MLSDRLIARLTCGQLPSKHIIISFTPFTPDPQTHVMGLWDEAETHGSKTLCGGQMSQLKENTDRLLTSTNQCS